LRRPFSDVGSTVILNSGQSFNSLVRRKTVTALRARPESH
jgi:hypothetical protein